VSLVYFLVFFVVFFSPQRTPRSTQGTQGYYARNKLVLI